MSRWGIVAVAYSLLAVAAACLATLWRDHSAITLADPWLGLGDGLHSHLFSGLLGLCVGAIAVLATKAMVMRFGFAARLHGELRPLALELSAQMVVVLATSSAIGEELLFRGLLQPEVGLVVQALLFGVLHQTGGSSRWVWMIWATLMGLILGAMYQLSGSLVGPVVAHAMINGFNLQFLKRHDPTPGRRPLGGLLGQRS
ncbi:MAG TPA: CPBP family intramembrane glutamic endopeptidase [Polyangiaceae bacterium]